MCEKLIIHESKSWQKPPINLALHVINPLKEYPHPQVYLIEPTPMLNVDADNVPMAHNKYLAAGWWRK